MKSSRFHYDNLLDHQVDTYEALVDGWYRRRRTGPFYEVLGRTDDGRYLQLIVDEREDHIWVFHGRDMNETERRRYGRK